MTARPFFAVLAAVAVVLLPASPVAADPAPHRLPLAGVEQHVVDGHPTVVQGELLLYASPSPWPWYGVITALVAGGAALALLLAWLPPRPERHTARSARRADVARLRAGTKGRPDRPAPLSVTDGEL